MKKNTKLVKKTKKILIAKPVKKAKVKKVIGGQSGGSSGLFALSPDNFAANGPSPAAHSGEPAGAAAQKASSCSSV